MYYASKQACKLPQDPKLAFCYDILNTVSRRCVLLLLLPAAAFASRQSSARFTAASSISKCDLHRYTHQRHRPLQANPLQPTPLHRDPPPTPYPSFAVVIQQLPNPLRDAICVFYLVLRGLDTVEDDMAIHPDKKIPDLLQFHEYIYRRGFKMDCGYGHYVRLMQKFDIVVDVFLSLEPGFQQVIADITRRMGAGMADFIQLDEVETLQQYDLYCHYAAGLVGIGLSQMWGESLLSFWGVGKGEWGGASWR